MFADFTLTDFGSQWIAQAVQDAQDGTHLAVLVSMDFGESDDGTPPSIDTLWSSDTASLYTWQGSNVIGIRGVASNLGDTEAHYFNLIQIRGKIGTTDGVIAYCQSDQTEEIPPASIQQVTRVATVSLAVSGAATVAMATPQTGYAIEEEVAKIAPAVNVGGLILGDGNGHTSTIDCNAAGELTTSGGARFGGDLRAAGEAVITTDITANGDLSIGGNATITGTIRAHNTIRRVIVRRSGGTTTWYADGVAGSGSALDIAAAINSAGGAGVYWSSDNPAPHYIAPVEVFDEDNFPTGTNWTFVCDRWWY